MPEGFYALLHETELHFYMMFYVKPNRCHVEIQETIMIEIKISFRVKMNTSSMELRIYF